MNKTIENSEKTRVLLQKHYQAYPKLQAEDIFKYIFQSAFGCEHMVSDEDAALAYIRREYAMCDKTEAPRKEELDGEYSRIHLSYLNGGLTEETLTNLFCLSAQKETEGGIALAQKLHVASELVADGILPLDRVDFGAKLHHWQELGCPAVHHSEAFRAAYHPAYRVIANRYAEFLEIFSAIDKLLCKGPAIIALEGGSASGKTTLADMLQSEDEDVDVQVERNILGKKAVDLLPKILEEREYKIICLRYGIGCEPLPQREAAALLGISRSYVSRIEKKALSKLKAALVGE